MSLHVNRSISMTTEQSPSTDVSFLSSRQEANWWIWSGPDGPEECLMDCISHKTHSVSDHPLLSNVSIFMEMLNDYG